MSVADKVAIKLVEANSACSDNAAEPKYQSPPRQWDKPVRKRSLDGDDCAVKRHKATESPCSSVTVTGSDEAEDDGTGSEEAEDDGTETEEAEVDGAETEEAEDDGTGSEEAEDDGKADDGTTSMESMSEDEEETEEDRRFVSITNELVLDDEDRAKIDVSNIITGTRTRKRMAHWTHPDEEIVVKKHLSKDIDELATIDSSDPESTESDDDYNPNISESAASNNDVGSVADDDGCSYIDSESNESEETDDTDED